MLFRGNRSINVPAVGDQKIDKIVINAYIIPKSGPSSRLLIKYHGIANIVMPCENPETKFAAISSRKALRFFIARK